jgi:F-type H+-transporting ATPase subunit epsilon
MAETFLLEIVTPYGEVVNDEVDTVVAPGADGEFGVLAGHTLFITPLKAGEVSYTRDNKTEHMVIGRGFAEVLPEKTTILANSAERAAKIELEGARNEAVEAEKALKKLSEEDPGYQSAKDAHELAMVKVKVSEKVQK